MSYSLQLRNGDLVVDEGRIGVVTGWQKLLQDLRCHLLEKLGTDSSYPDFGSALDGGTAPDGTEIDSPIGETDRDVVEAFVVTEINRVIREHQNKQLARVRDDQYTYGKTTLTQGELLESADINIGFQDTMMVIQIVVRSEGLDRRFSIPIQLS